MGGVVYRGAGGGGGGLILRRNPDIFTGTSTVALAARDTYFQTTSPSAINEFVQNRNLCIVIRATQGAGTADTFQTWLGEDSGTTYDNSMWANRTDAVQGPTGASSTVPGPKGDKGDPGNTGPIGRGSAAFDENSLLLTQVWRWGTVVITNQYVMADFTKDPDAYATGSHILLPDPLPTGFDIKVTDGSGTTDDDLEFRIGGDEASNAATVLGAAYFTGVPDRTLLGLMVKPEITQGPIDPDADPVVMTAWETQNHQGMFVPWGSTIGPGVTNVEQLYEFVITDQTQGAAATRPSQVLEIATGFVNWDESGDEFIGTPYWAVGIEAKIGSTTGFTRHAIAATVGPAAMSFHFYPVWAE